MEKYLKKVLSSNIKIDYREIDRKLGVIPVDLKKANVSYVIL